MKTMHDNEMFDCCNNLFRNYPSTDNAILAFPKHLKHHFNLIFRTINNDAQTFKGIYYHFRLEK